MKMKGPPNSDINGNLALGEQILEAEGLLPNIQSGRRKNKLVSAGMSKKSFLHRPIPLREKPAGFFYLGGYTISYAGKRIIKRRLYAIRIPAYSYIYYCLTSFYYLVCFGRDKTFR
jgi:hypothetical protein